MHSALLYTHSILRYFLLLLLITVIVRALLGVMNKKPFTRTDDMISLTLFSFTHTQFLVGIILYFVSPLVQFNSESMKDHALRYWTSEHIVMMLIAIILISVARTTSKKLKEDIAKHRRLLILNALAIVIILAAIAMSQRGFFSVTTPAT